VWALSVRVSTWKAAGVRIKADGPENEGGQFQGVRGVRMGAEMGKRARRGVRAEAPFSPEFRPRGGAISGRWFYASNFRVAKHRVFRGFARAEKT